MKSYEIKKFLADSGEPSYRYRQIMKAVYKDGCLSFKEITVLPAALKKKLDVDFRILPFEVLEVLHDQEGGSKALLKLPDGEKTETVLVRLREDIISACVSSQAGCAMGCRFCATGQRGFRRNLSSEEIIAQAVFWTGYLKGKVVGAPESGARESLTNIVYMGMGEPFMNWDEVRESLRVLTDKDTFGIGARNISVSTIGIPQGIRALGREWPQINLAVSLHGGDDRTRNLIVPAGKKYGLAVIKDALEDYFLHANRKVFLEYVLLDNVNDSLRQAEKLSEFIHSFQKDYLLHVNLIPYNQTTGFEASQPEKVRSFFEFLKKNGVSTTIRKSLGKGIKGACGQLAA